MGSNQLFTTDLAVNIKAAQQEGRLQSTWREQKAKHSAQIHIFPHYSTPSAWDSVCPALFSVKTSKACRIAWLALYVSPGPSIALTCCLSDKHSRCWHYQMLSACRPPCFCPVMALRRGEQPGHLTLSGCDCVCARASEQAWMCMRMLQIDLPLVCHIKLALCWPPSCLQALLYITQLSLAALRTSFAPWQKKSMIITAEQRNESWKQAE